VPATVARSGFAISTSRYSAARFRLPSLSSASASCFTAARSRSSFMPSAKAAISAMVMIERISSWLMGDSRELFVAGGNGTEHSRPGAVSRNYLR
jgi:hypothetical protein